MNGDIVRAGNANCQCEHGYKPGVGFPEDRCQEVAVYWSHSKQTYLCFQHANVKELHIGE